MAYFKWKAEVEDAIRFFEQLLIWNRQKLTKFLEKNPELLRK